MNDHRGRGGYRRGFRYPVRGSGRGEVHGYRLNTSHYNQPQYTSQHTPQYMHYQGELYGPPPGLPQAQRRESRTLPRPYTPIPYEGEPEITAGEKGKQRANPVELPTKGDNLPQNELFT